MSFEIQAVEYVFLRQIVCDIILPIPQLNLVISKVIWLSRTQKKEFNKILVMDWNGDPIYKIDEDEEKLRKVWGCSN